MKKIFTFFFIILCSCFIIKNLQAQQQSFPFTYDVYSNIDDHRWHNSTRMKVENTDVIINNDGSKIIAGYTEVSYSVNGEKDDSLNRIAPQDTYIYLSTSTDTYKLIEGLPRDISYVLKLKQDNTLEWFHFIERTGTGNLTTDLLGNVYCIFTKLSQERIPFSKNGITYPTNSVLLKIDGEGNIVDTKPIGQLFTETGTGRYFTKNIIEVDFEGNLIVTFSVHRNNSYDDYTNTLYSFLIGNQEISINIEADNIRRQSLMIKTDNQLNLLWYKKLTSRGEFPNRSAFISIINVETDKKGNITILTNSIGNIHSQDSLISINKGSHIITYSKEGNFKYISYTGAEAHGWEFSNLYKDKHDNTYCTAGYSTRISKIDNEGNSIWSLIFVGMPNTGDANSLYVANNGMFTDIYGTSYLLLSLVFPPLLFPYVETDTLSLTIGNKVYNRYSGELHRNYQVLLKISSTGQVEWSRLELYPSNSLAGQHNAHIHVNDKGNITYKFQSTLSPHFFTHTTDSTYIAVEQYWKEGKAFAEKGNNCSFDDTDIGFPSVLIKRNDGRIGISNKEGNYSLGFVDNGFYSITPQLINSALLNYSYVYDLCDSTKEISFINGEVVQNIDFGYKVNPCSYLTIDITNKQRRRCFMSSTTVEYKNQGFADAQNVEVKVEYPDYIFPVSSSPAWTRKEGNTYFFNVGSLTAGNSAKIVFQDSVVCGIEEIRGLTQCLKATISPANTCEDWTDTENKYEISGRCVGGGMARYTIKNLTNIATDSIPYRLYANSKVFAERNTLLPANGEVEIEVFTNGMTMRMELFPQNHDPISAFVEGCQVTIPYKTKAENPNPVVSVAPVRESGIALPQNDGGERSETSCSEILDSYDPNDKQVVPFGLTNQNLIEKTTELDYTIRFQNTGTIEAVNIVVLDTLSEFLDIETIRLGMVSHDYKLLIDGDADTRILRFEFDNINLPDSNTNEPASHGFIKFKIKQKANNAIGTIIKNRAAIYFDFNSPIITNTISNKVAVLPLRDNNLNLPVFNCSDASFELNANAGTDIETPNSTATLSAQATQVFGNWSLLSGFGELENPSKNNSKVTGLLPFPTKLVWRVAACGEAKQDTVIVQSTNTDYKFTIDFNQTESKLSVPTGKVTYQWYRDGVLITGQTGAKLDLSTLENRIGVYTVVISSGDTSITSEPFTIDKILSNDDFIKANYIKIYPNPTTSLLNVELNTILNASEVTLVNALGMELQKTVITNSNKITLDLENLSNGIYFVKIISQKGIFYKKVVLKK